MRSLILLAYLSTAPATAVPKLDYLFPAGGKQGATVDVVLGGTFDVWPVQSWTSHPGILVTPGKQAGQVRIAIAGDVPRGVHWLRVFDKTGASGPRPFLVDQMSEITEIEPNDDYRKPQEVVATPVIVNGRLVKNDDVDHFAVRLKRGATLVAAVTAGREIRSPMDAVVQILSAEGFVLAQNDDFYEIDPLIAFEAPKDGTYIVRLFCFPQVADSRVGFFGKETCVYRLTLTTGPFVDRVWPLAVEQGAPGNVEVLGWNIPEGRRRATVNVDENADLTYLQPDGFAGGAFVRIEPHRVFEVSSEMLPSPLLSFFGRFAKPGERFTIPFAAKKKDAFSLRVEAREVRSPVDAVVSIRTKAGAKLQRVQSDKLNLDPKLEFVAPDDGEYVLELRDLHDDSGPRHSFLIRILAAKPSFDVAATQDRVSVKAGKPGEIPVNITRRHGFKSEIAFRTVGLPDSVRIEAVEGKDATKWTVRLLDLPETFNGPFRLMANSKDAKLDERRVMANVAELNSTVADLWLTVTPAEK